VDRLINFVVTVTLIEMMAAIGLGVPLGELLAVMRNGRLLAGAVLANYGVVPAATVCLLLLFAAEPSVGVGFLILAVCPGAPYGPPFAAIARGNLGTAVGLMVFLAGSSALIAPIQLHYLVPMVSGDATLEVDSGRMALTLLITQLLPLGVGLAIRRWRPIVAERLGSPANRLSKALNLVAVVLILVAHYNLLWEIPARAFVGMLILLLASLAHAQLCRVPANPPEPCRSQLRTASIRTIHRVSKAGQAPTGSDVESRADRFGRWAGRADAAPRHRRRVERSRTCLRDHTQSSVPYMSGPQISQPSGWVRTSSPAPRGWSS
jgi:bile acid:Na+ symporter, BASS family